MVTERVWVLKSYLSSYCSFPRYSFCGPWKQTQRSLFFLLVTVQLYQVFMLSMNTNSDIYDYYSSWVSDTDKKENQIFLSSYTRKFRMEQLQNNIWLTASMVKYLRISSYTVLGSPSSYTEWLCNCSTLNFLKYEENFIFLFISVEWNTKAFELSFVVRSCKHRGICLTYPTAAPYVRFLSVPECNTFLIEACPNILSIVLKKQRPLANLWIQNHVLFPRIYSDKEILWLNQRYCSSL